MDKIIITPEKIEHIYNTFDELEKLQFEETDLINAAKTSKGEMASVTRRSGETIEVTEGLLWEEVYHMGAMSEGYEILRGKYPKVFEKSEEHAKKLEELTAYCLTELGIHPLKLRLSDIMRLMDALITYRMTSDKAETTMTYE